ncbi:DedA family protein [Dermatophilus congolensis]|nr:hypothetical protein [Dermatophilus congolensis]MBO3130258.1 hypothetical protein [Dermatophilus congolensis]MBO3131112.1 hypothetical protein [Dermatophilus congolensis]MBO3134729.1 hypothetical protein [Dermatophilus congolensis]MBO3139210.1 hypothetical protein [Dermatophilus congolensis]MBO3141446.1 hypothetical protein [Dermatophilus congolensis]
MTLQCPNVLSVSRSTPDQQPPERAPYEPMTSMFARPDFSVPHSPKESDKPQDSAPEEMENTPTTLWPQGTKFGRADRICLGLIIGVTVFGLIMMPARPVILTWSPLVIVALTGSRTGLVACGALASTGQAGMPTPLAIALPLVIGVISMVKFTPIYWWAGKLWGDWFITALAGQTERQQKRAARAESLARRYMIPAIGLTYVPFVPIPAAIIHAVLGASGTSLKKFLSVNLVFAAIVQSIYFTMGWYIGEPAVALLDELAKYSLWLALGIFVFIMIGSFRTAARTEKERQNRRSGNATRAAHDDQP